MRVTAKQIRCVVDRRWPAAWLTSLLTVVLLCSAVAAMAKPTPSMDKQQSEASFDHHRVAQPSLVAYARPGHPLPVVRSCSRCLGASAERTPSPSSITTTTYAYDRDDRLIQTTVSHQPSDTSTPDERSDWTLDAVGNRRSETVTRLSDNTTTSDKQYVYSDRDQLTLMTDTVNQLTVEYSYDPNGNRTQRTVTRQGQPPETTGYTFDARDRLTGVQPNAPNAPRIAYQYDADGRRIERIAFPATGQNPAATLYLYNGSSLLHEAIPDANATSPNSAGLRLTDTYRTSVKLDRHLAFDLAGNASVRFYQLDALDTPVAMTDANGNTVTRTTFDAWGNIEQQIAGGVVQTPWQLPNYNPDQTGQAALLTNDGQLIGFTGYQKDPATGLYYAGARWYDPLTSSFNGMDPAQGNPNSPVSLHRYLYANGNPLIFIDPDGRVGFLTTARNFFDRTDQQLRAISVLLPFFADDIGTVRGGLALASVPVRATNLASDVVAQALPGNAFSTVADQGSAELGNTVDAVVPLVRDYITNPEATKARIGLAVGTKAVNTVVGAAKGDGGAISDLYSFVTQIAAPAVAAEAVVARGLSVGAELGESVVAGSRLPGPVAAGPKPALSGALVRNGSSPADAVAVGELGEGGVGFRAMQDRPLAKLADAERRIALRQRVMAAIADNQAATKGSLFDMQVGFETAMFGDVSSKGRQIVLFSRRDRFRNENKDLAKRFADHNGFVILNDTPAGSKLGQLALFERFANPPGMPPNIAISAQTLRMWDTLSERFIRQAPTEVPIFGFVDGTIDSTVFRRVELMVIHETDRMFVPVRAKGRVTDNGK